MILLSFYQRNKTKQNNPLLFFFWFFFFFPLLIEDKLLYASLQFTFVLLNYRGCFEKMFPSSEKQTEILQAKNVHFQIHSSSKAFAFWTAPYPQTWTLFWTETLSSMTRFVTDMSLSLFEMTVSICPSHCSYCKALLFYSEPQSLFWFLFITTGHPCQNFLSLEGGLAEERLKSHTILFFTLKYLIIHLGCMIT